MLYIYEGVDKFENFTEQIYKDIYKEDKNYQEILLDYNVLLFDEEEYKVDKINDYMDFYKYKAVDKENKVSIFNNFDRVDLKIQNKLLKIFEDSLDYHILIINNKSRVLNTIKSRALFKEVNNDNKNLENYPKRYHELLEIISSGEEEMSEYLKFYDFLLKKEFKSAYLFLTTKLKEYNISNVYEIIQYSNQKTNANTKELLELQKRLLSNTNKKLQIENYLLNK